MIEPAQMARDGQLKVHRLCGIEVTRDSGSDYTHFYYFPPMTETIEILF